MDGLGTVVHGWCTVANSSCLTAAAVVHDVHGLRGSGGNSAGRGSWSPNGGRWVSSYPSLFSLSQNMHNMHNVHTRCATAASLFAVVHDVRGLALDNPPRRCSRTFAYVRSNGLHLFSRHQAPSILCNL